jgi:hypothetical protein
MWYYLEEEEEKEEKEEEAQEEGRLVLLLLLLLVLLQPGRAPGCPPPRRLYTPVTFKNRSNPLYQAYDKNG